MLSVLLNTKYKCIERTLKALISSQVLTSRILPKKKNTISPVGQFNVLLLWLGCHSLLLHCPWLSSRTSWLRVFFLLCFFFRGFRTNYEKENMLFGLPNRSSGRWKGHGKWQDPGVVLQVPQIPGEPSVQGPCAVTAENLAQDPAGHKRRLEMHFI